jgi:hypothetical protein
MSLYYLFWAILVGATLWASLGGFLWAYRQGQFKDQERARYLPLRGEAGPLMPGGGSGAGPEVSILVGILTLGVLGLLGLLTALFLVVPGVRL